MGIVIDIILVGIVLISAFLGYKQGLVKVGAGLFAGIIAIILTVILYNPTAKLIMDKTKLDENIQDMFIKNATKFVGEEKNTNSITDGVVNNINNQIKNEAIPSQAQSVSTYAVYAITGIALFVAIKILLSIVFSLMGFIAELPILKQFNEAGGLIYGIARGILFSAICIAILVMLAKVDPANKLNKYAENSQLMKIVYEKIN